MTVPVCYDITRLLTRVLKKTPNGIDRLDLAYASHYLGSEDVQGAGLVHLTPGLPRALSRERSRDAIAAIAQHLGEDPRETVSDDFSLIMAWLRGTLRQKPVLTKRQDGRTSYPKVAQFYWRHLGLKGMHPRKFLPPDSRYLCVSQYPMSEPGAFSWLTERPDVKAVFFIHDMLPIEYPEYFQPKERGRNEQRMQALARHGAGALVTTHTMKQSLLAYMAKLGRPNLPVHVSPVPLAPAFYGESTKALAEEPPYFVMCSTIEPRKNHLTILKAWRSMAASATGPMPKLVLVGSRGWENENVIDMLDRSPAVREHVLEVNGLSTPDLVKLMQGARAVLMPSFAEGYGLPVAEALSLGVPVMASDIPVFHEIANGQFIPVSPINGDAWIEKLQAACRQPLPRPVFALQNPKAPGYFAQVDAFLASL